MVSAPSYSGMRRIDVTCYVPVDWGDRVELVVSPRGQWEDVFVRRLRAEAQLALLEDDHHALLAGVERHICAMRVALEATTDPEGKASARSILSMLEALARHE